jgi:uncharacterized protein YjiS (DUF1127 family)
MIVEQIASDTLGYRRGALRCSPWAAADAALGHAAAILFAWLERQRQRQQLLGLTDRELGDFGIGRADAVGEGDRPFWRR